MQYEHSRNECIRGVRSSFRIRHIWQVANRPRTGPKLILCRGPASLFRINLTVVIFINVLKSVRRLQLMQLFVETLKTTEIGRIVNDMRKYNSKQIHSLARTLVEFAGASPEIHLSVVSLTSERIR